MYKQTANSILLILREIVMFTIVLSALLQYNAEFLPFDPLAVLFSAAISTVLWIIGMVIIHTQDYPSLKSDRLPQDILHHLDTKELFDLLKRYTKGFKYTQLYLISNVLSSINKLVLGGIVITFIYSSAGFIYLSASIVLLLILPTIYIITQKPLESTDLSKKDIDVAQFNSVTDELLEHYGLSRPNIHVLDMTDRNKLLVIKSMFIPDTLVITSGSIANLNSSDSLESKADLFKLAHEFSHLSISSQYTIRSNILIFISTALYLGTLFFTGMNASNIEVLLLSLTYIFFVKLVSSHFKRMEEYESDRQAAEFTNASAEEHLVSLTMITENEENPFTFPVNTLLGKLYTLFSSHPSIYSRIEYVLSQDDILN